MNIVAAIVLGSFGLIGWFSHLRNQRYQASVEARTTRFNKIVDRFSDETELLDFLKSDRGLALINTLIASGKGTKVPILVTASAGIVAIFVGLGALYLMLTVEDDMIFPAVFMPSVGLGLITAAAFSYFLGRKWGLFDEETDNLLNGE